MIPTHHRKVNQCHLCIEDGGMANKSLVMCWTGTRPLGTVGMLQCGVRQHMYLRGKTHLGDGSTVGLNVNSPFWSV